MDQKYGVTAKEWVEEKKQFKSEVSDNREPY